MLAPNLLGRHPADQQVRTKHHVGTPTATPGINQHSPLDRLISCTTAKKKKKPWTINMELKMNMQQKGQNAVGSWEKGGEARSWSPHKLSVNKGSMTNSSLVIRYCLKYGRWWSTKLISWASDKHPKSNNTANHHNTLTAGSWLTDHWPCPRERGQGKETSPQ
jgi:hypothetical protein